MFSWWMMKIKKYASLDSTNAEALRLIAAGKAYEGLVIQAEEQTHGKGAGQNTWESAPGQNLTFSVILQPHFVPPAQQFVLTEMVSLALLEVLKTRLENHVLKIKWPNDIWCNDKKIAGILIQNRIKGDLLDYSVVGVGLNVNQTTFRSGAPNPASLKSFTGKNEERFALLHAILEKVSGYYTKLRTDRKALEPLYLHNLYHFNEQASYADDQGLFTGKITGVDSFGRLILVDSSGVQHIYGFKEVRFL
ncbi:MAG TPA: biotin--[acetyl-CoA-carboxylase] ligase [Bacteroidetes bacterium]|nr:biotin--[acetyl-CoA-carboxylase] ligase [Bacteroidota bacterium]